MVYIMEIYTDGGCRGNGQPGAIGAAAAAFKKEMELTAIILALQRALEKVDELDTNPYLNVKIYSDSRYAINCMTNWIYKWVKNGWITAAGNEVANRDLLQEASDLDDRLAELGDVEYIWIPRENNQYADRLCTEDMDEQ
ncbi:hypothetical protein QQS21_001590 [Conoideocrella luteorostrata]|uniref:ribonuclease H n=1 Tax=Conoideocrella luteorostrata TaxID=1105319 RepID=A0AAJ0CWT2_9HYPO|nr:hypothetical protein QQS21_001590 [Conoideocrella luteorostrata]